MCFIYLDFVRIIFAKLYIKLLHDILGFLLLIIGSVSVELSISKKLSINFNIVEVTKVIVTLFSITISLCQAGTAGLNGG